MTNTLMRKNCRILMTAIFLILAPTVAFAIQFSGVTSEHQKDLRRNLPKLFTSPTPLSVIDDALRILYKTGQYESIKAEEINGEIRITSTPVKRIRHLSVNGNSQLSENEILQLLSVENNEEFDRIKILEGGERIKARYEKLGFFKSQVGLDFSIAEEATKVDITVAVNEGPACTINEIQFGTSNEQLKSKITKMTKKYVGKNYEEDLVQDITNELRDYFSDNRLLTANLQGPEIKFDEDRTRASLIYSLERPFRFILLFEGNSSISSSELIRELQIEEQKVAGANPAADLAEKVSQIYRTKGFAHVEVKQTERVYNANFSRQIIFTIKEGPKVKLQKLEMMGTLSKPKSEYEDFILEHSSSLASRGYYHRADIEKGLENLVFELQNQGYLKAKIQSTRVEFSKDKTQAKVFVYLDEGPLTVIESVSFNGNNQVSATKLKEVVGLKVSQPLSLKQLEDTLRLLESHYTSNGYIDMQILNKDKGLVLYSDDNTKAKIVYELYEGPQVKVANITFEGNDKTRDYVIDHELEFKNGDILTPEKVNDSIYRLQRLGLFSEVSITTLEKGSQIADRTVIVRVMERPPGLFTSGVGVNSEFGVTLRGYLGLGYRNIGGTARALTGRLELKRVSDIEFMDHQITAGYLEPYLLDSRTRGRVNLTRSLSITSRDRASQQVLANETNELELLLEREFFRNLKVTWNLWSIASIREFELDDRRETTTQIIATVGPTVELDYRDNPFNPTIGHFTRLNSEYSNPKFGSSDDIEYLRVNGNFTHYLRLSGPRWVWANSVRGGYIKNLSETGGVPESKIFFLGGRSTIRGFDPLQIPRRDSLAPKDKAYRLDSESHFYLVKSEIRFPIYGDLGGVFFYDGGAVKVLGKVLEPEFRDSVGLGIRYNTPVGPVSAEYGYKLNRVRELNESEGRFHLSIGTF